MKHTALIGSLASLGLVLVLASGQAVAQSSHPGIQAHPEMQTPSLEQTRSFHPIEQPIGNRIAVTLGGLGLIGLELWWFLLSKPKSRQAVVAEGGVQEVTVTVDGGDDPATLPS